MIAIECLEHGDCLGHLALVGRSEFVLEIAGVCWSSSSWVARRGVGTEG